MCRFLEKFKTEICDNCINEKCDKGIYIFDYKGTTRIKCCEYINKNKGKIQIEEWKCNENEYNCKSN